MSNWTHVAGIIRLDAYQPDCGEQDFDALIGKECPWDAPKEVWDEAYEHPERFLPMGSEGSLQKTIWINPNKAETAAYTISIFGDLRDSESAVDVVDWFRKLHDRLSRNEKIWGVRNAVITATNEWNGSAMWTQPDDDWVWQKDEPENN